MNQYLLPSSLTGARFYKGLQKYEKLNNYTVI